MSRWAAVLHRKPPGPTARAQATRRRKQLAAERAIKAQVRERDGTMCRCCGMRKAESVHEIVPKSVGGKVSLANSVYLCGDGVRGCHGLAQRHEIKIEAVARDAGVPVDANRGPLCFVAHTAKARRWLDLPGDWVIRP